MNLHGKEEFTLLRDYLSIFDNNVFVTIWVTEILLEADRLGVVDVPEKSILDAVEATITYKDKNFPLTQRYSFWPQKKQGETWIAWPINLEHIGADIETTEKWLHTILHFLHLDHLWEKIAPAFLGIVRALRAFHIPADFDDTYCNEAMGMLLAQSRAKFPNAHAVWDAYHPPLAFEAILNDTVRYAYRPFSRDFDESTIDPRSYYFMREFRGPADISLPTTWIQSTTEAIEWFDKLYCMPFSVNNVDASVLANIMLGLTERYTAYPADTDWYSRVSHLYDEMADYIAWTIDSGELTKRIDIALLYYPNEFAFLWFASRTLSALDDLLAEGGKIPPEMEYARKTLEASLRGTGTKFFLSNAIAAKDGVYFEQWLGNGDEDISGKPVKHGEDRIFSVAAAINTLLDVWTVRSSKTKEIRWLDETPAEVRAVVQKAALFLDAHVTEKEHLQNCFFSGSVKGLGQLPFFYPATLVRWINGTIIPPEKQHYPTEDMLELMVGKVDPARYEQMIHEQHFDGPTPTTFPGFNTGIPFPYWSSPALSQAASVLALSRCARMTW